MRTAVQRDQIHDLKFAYENSSDDRPVVQEVRTADSSRRMVLHEWDQYSIRRSHLIRPVSAGLEEARA